MSSSDTPRRSGKSRVRRSLAWWRKRVPAWVATIITLGAILWLTLARDPLPDNDLPTFPGIDKVVHAIMFGWLTLVMCWDWYVSRRCRLVPLQIALCALLSILLGGAIEIAQGAMGFGRSADIWDFTADTIGSLAVMAALLRRP